MAYGVSLLPRAKDDLETIYRRIILQTPLQGALWFNELERAIYSLRNHPQRCQVVSRLSTSSVLVRQLLFGNYPHIYKIYHQTVGNIVEVMHIRHGARRQAKRRDLSE